MPQLEKTLVDKFVAGAYYGKRKIGRPMKYNIRNQGRTGWIELVFNPRTRVEQYISDAMKFAHPYIFAMTYKFHVEKAREAGKYLFSSARTRACSVVPSHQMNHAVTALKFEVQHACPLL